MPVGLFREADRRRHLACLGSWYEGASRRGLLEHGPFRVHRFGRAAENERIDALGDPIPIDVPLRDAEGRPATVRVELYGRTEIVSRSLPGSLTCVPRDSARDKDFLGGFLDAVVLSLVPGHHDPAGYEVHVLTASSGDPERLQRRFRDLDAEHARAYLAGLLSDMLGASHAYLLPCEAVFEFLAEAEAKADLGDRRGSQGEHHASAARGTAPCPTSPCTTRPTTTRPGPSSGRRFGLYRDCGGCSHDRTLPEARRFSTASRATGRP